MNIQISFYIILTAYWRKPRGLFVGPYCYKCTNYKV